MIIIHAVFIGRQDGKLFALLRDADIPKQLMEAEGPLVGFIGSDTFGELPDQFQDKLEFIPLRTLDVRFALACPGNRVDKVDDKLRRAETVSVATSFPRASAGMVGALGSPLRVVSTPKGSVEALPYVRSDVDAVVDLVKSGETARLNGLEIVRDNLGAVTLGAVWKREGGIEAACSTAQEIDFDALMAAERTILKRVRSASAGDRSSYTQRLAGDPNNVVKKIGEETAEFLAAFLTGSPANCEEESADVLYGMTVALACRGSSLTRALGMLASRNRV